MRLLATGISFGETTLALVPCGSTVGLLLVNESRMEIMSPDVDIPSTKEALRGILRAREKYNGRTKAALPAKPGTDRGVA